MLLIKNNKLIVNGNKLGISVPKYNGIKNNQILYTSNTNAVVDPYVLTAFGDASLISNTYEDGVGIIKFDTDVTTIGLKAFYQRSSLTSITIPNSVISIGTSAFQDCSGLTSITIPNSVTSIDKSAFNRCSGLTSITIPNSVTSIGGSAFKFCSKLTSVVWNAANCSDFSSVSNSPFFGINNQITSFEFGDSVEHIPSYLCYNMPNLISITIPDSVTSIGKSAFNRCSGLTSITIPNLVTAIGNNVFLGCNLTSIEIPDSVTRIGSYAFLSCTRLTSIIIPESVTSIGDSAFDGCSVLASVTMSSIIPPSLVSSAFEHTSSDLIIYVPDESVDTYKAATNWNSYADKIKPMSLKPV